MSEVADPWGLTPKMRSVLTAYVESANQKRAAQRLGINQSTLNMHMVRAVRRMGVINSFQAAIWWDRFTRDQDEQSDRSGGTAATT